MPAGGGVLGDVEVRKWRTGFGEAGEGGNGTHSCSVRDGRSYQLMLAEPWYEAKMPWVWATL